MKIIKYLKFLDFDFSIFLVPLEGWEVVGGFPLYFHGMSGGGGNISIVKGFEMNFV